MAYVATKEDIRRQLDRMESNATRCSQRADFLREQEMKPIELEDSELLILGLPMKTGHVVLNASQVRCLVKGYEDSYHGLQGKMAKIRKEHGL